MLQNIKSLLFCVFIFLILNIKPCFALEANVVENIYPDYACEFCGKDKFEGFNRKLFVFNLKMNKCIVKPINIIWASVMPKYGMDRLQSVYNNANYPLRVASCLLQKDFRASRQETARFFINTTVGFAGMYDPASTKFKIEARQEDMSQVLAHYNIKQGPYLVLPVVRGNIRDLAGKLLNCPFRPTAYIGAFGAAINAVFSINNITYSQPMIKKVDDSFADPYELVKQVDGISSFIKNNNLDRSEVFLEKIASQNFVPAGIVQQTPQLQTDIVLKDFHPQGSLTDSMRTTYFDNQKTYSSAWSELSVWNKCFNKQIKNSEIVLYPDKPKYRFKYILQKSKSSPLAVIYPSIGDGIASDKSAMLAKILFEQGYSVIIQGSSFNWEFIKSMPDGYHPGIPSEDAKLLKMTTSKIIETVEKNHDYKFQEKLLVGCSFGALTGLFTLEQDEKDNQIGFSKLIAISPPIEIFYALKCLDKYTQDWKKDDSDIKMRTALAGQKVVRLSQQVFDKKVEEMPESLPFTEEESKLVIGFLMKQKLSDTLFAIEHCSRCKKSDLYKKINSMSYYDYAKKYVFTNNQSDEKIDYETSLYTISDFLKNSRKYKIYHAIDDYFTNKEQIAWLKKTSGNKTILFSNGSHLGFLYRKEFMENFLDDIKITKSEINSGV